MPRTSAARRSRSAGAPAEAAREIAELRARLDDESRIGPASGPAAPRPRRGAPGTAEGNALAMAVRTRLTAVVGPVAVALFTLDADRFPRLVGTAGVPSGVATTWWSLPPRPTTPTVAAVARGRPFWLPDLAKSRRRYVLIGEPDVVWPSRAWLPIRDGNRIMGVAGVLCAQPQVFDPRVRRAVTRGVAQAAPAFRRLLGARPGRDRGAADAQAILDQVAARLPLIERLGGLGWAEWDLTTHTVNWSDQLLAIFGRGPDEGPAGLADLPGLVVPEDAAAIERAIAGLLRGGQPMDVRFRIRVPTGVRHVRAVFETANDDGGRPVRAFGIVQDMTVHDTAERIRHRLVGVERELADRQRVQRAEHRMVATLQQIILPLPSRPIQRPGLRVAVRYQPAEELARVGGDWYDVVALPAGRTLIAVGDVAGHGVTAAATMARLRHALAALAVTTSDPAELLGYLNRIVCDDPAEPTATVVVGRYDPHTRVLAWAQAGHPPPILISDGTAAALERPPGVLVGARREAVYAGAEVSLSPGSRLLLYTDGLIERRGRADTDWLAPILGTLATAEPAPVEALLAHLRPANPDDDLCVLGLHLLPPA